MKFDETKYDFALQIFISYSHKDRLIVNSIVEKLREERIDVWVDQNEMLAGESIRVAIEDAIEQTDIYRKQCCFCPGRIRENYRMRTKRVMGAARGIIIAKIAHQRQSQFRRIINLSKPNLNIRHLSFS